MADDFDSTSSVARGWRRWLPWALLTLAAVVLLAGSLTVWVKRQALSTDAWADTSEQLIQDPDTRAAVASYLVDQALARGEAAVQRLPSNLEALAPSLSASSRDAVTRAAEQLLERPAVQSLWVEANREAHRAFLDVVAGKPGRLTSRGDSLVLDFTTGNLFCWVLNQRGGGFMAQYMTNVRNDFGPLEQGRNPEYLLVTGFVNVAGGAGADGRPADSVVYVADANSGAVVGYSLVWNRARAAAGGAQGGGLIKVAQGLARDANLIRQ